MFESILFSGGVSLLALSSFFPELPYVTPDMIVFDFLLKCYTLAETIGGASKFAPLLGLSC